MKKITYYIALLLVSCSSGGDKGNYVEPDMDRVNFIQTLVDLHTLESHYQRLYSRPDVYKEALDSASYHIFKAHNITKQEYELALMQYSYSVDTIFKIYETALDTITLRIGYQN